MKFNPDTHAFDLNPNEWAIIKRRAAIYKAEPEDLAEAVAYDLSTGFADYTAALSKIMEGRIA